MARTNVARRGQAKTHEGATAQIVRPEFELRRTVATCLLWEDTFYEKGSAIAERIQNLVPRVPAQKVADLALEARNRLLLRHVPLLLVRELARVKGNGPLVAGTLANVIQRADELTEFLSLYWKDGKQPLSHGVKKGLAAAFPRFDAYQLAKYDRPGTVKLRDVLFLTHAKPLSPDMAAVWKKLVDGTLESPDTWEVGLSAGEKAKTPEEKRAIWERLLKEKRLGGLAVLRNLRNMQHVQVDESLIRQRLREGVAKALPFRFIAAARHAPWLEDAIEDAMLAAVQELPRLVDSTGLLIDVSGSMEVALSQKSELTRLDAAAGLAIYLRDRCHDARVATFSHGVVKIPGRRGFALRDAIYNSQPHSVTYLGRALEALYRHELWTHLRRIIIITDEQVHDRILPAPEGCLGYVVNVASYQYGVSYGNGWTHIDGWSERVFDYIREAEALEAGDQSAD